MSLTLNTSLGPLKIELACREAPKACKNFLALCASNYYDGTVFHKNIAGFAVQGGDPTGTGKGGESVYDEKFFEDEISPALKHDAAGVLSMANRNKPCTNGSQFFITYAPQPQLDGQCTVFGRVLDGRETLARMEAAPVGKKYRPEKDIVLESVTIHANPMADEEF